MNRLLVPVFGDDGDTVALDAALAFASTDTAVIEAKYFHRDPVAVLPYMGEGVNPRAMEQIVADFGAQSAQMREGIAAGVRNWAHRAGLSGPSESDNQTGPAIVFEDVMGKLPESIISHARLADVSVFARGFGHDNPDREDMLDLALLESGRPTLLAPSPGTATIGNHVVIAWNGSAEAARALTTAMPLCHKAKQVTVIAINPDYGDDVSDAPSRAENPKAIAKTLAMNGINAGAITAGQHGDDIAEALMREAKTVDADLIVVGAYSHNRLRQWFLGGVTRSYRAAGDLAVLMTR